jgi:hypothetical protein
MEVDNPFTKNIDMVKVAKTRMGVAEAALGIKFSL